MSNRMLYALALVTTIIAACSDPAGVPKLVVSSVEVSAAGPTLTVGDSMIVTAFPRTADGLILGDRPVDWTSGNATVAGLTPKGATSMRRALTPGSAEIVAAVEGKIGRITVAVVAAPLVVSIVQVAPSIGAIEVGKQFQLRSVARAADGTVIGGRNTVWQSSDSTIMTIAGAADGSHVTISAHRVGAVVITATVDGVTGQRPIQVKPLSPVAYIGIEPDSLIVETGKD